MVNFTNPHKPFHAPPAHLHSFGSLPPLELMGTRSDNPGPTEYRANRREPRLDPYYFAMLQALDTEIERLVTSLSDHTERPIVYLFLGDNGSAAEVFAPVDDARVRSKATLYDGGVRVPLMMWSSHPDRFAMRSGESDHLLHFVDLFPTLATLADVSVQDVARSDRSIDGVSFAQEVVFDQTERPKPREFVFLERGNDEILPYTFGAVDELGMKLILRDPVRHTNYSPGRLIEIYDTSADPLEQENLFDVPCQIPEQRVSALLAFIADKIDHSESNARWFSSKLYRQTFENRVAECASQD